jgi:hypothetical protein
MPVTQQGNGTWILSELRETEVIVHPKNQVPQIEPFRNFPEIHPLPQSFRSCVTFFPFS